MRIFVVNLDQDVEKLANIDRQLKQSHLEYTRIPAVFGRDLSHVEKSKAVNRFRWWAAMGRWDVRDGEIGCALSHHAIYNEMILKRIPVACIVEDDLVLHDGFADMVEYVEAHIDRNIPSVVLLTNLSRETSLSDHGMRIVESRADFCTAGYILTQKAASVLLEVNTPLSTPCDQWGRWAHRGYIKLFHAFPTCCHPDVTTYESLTSPRDVVSVSSMSFPVKVIYKVQRCIGLMMDRLIYFLESK